MEIFPTFFINGIGASERFEQSLALGPCGSVHGVVSVSLLQCLAKTSTGELDPESRTDSGCTTKSSTVTPF